MQSNSGFTLIELILVTVIIGILAGMVVVTFGGRVQESQIRAAKGDIASFGTAIDLYALDHNDVYPPALNALTVAVNGKRSYVKELRNDPWGNPYNYRPATSALKADYQVWSSGPDGVPGNDDDVTSTSAME
jgi:general secretion pathway protein G